MTKSAALFLGLALICVGCPESGNLDGGSSSTTNVEVDNVTADAATVQAGDVLAGDVSAGDLEIAAINATGTVTVAEVPVDLQVDVQSAPEVNVEANGSGALGIDVGDAEIIFAEGCIPNTSDPGTSCRTAGVYDLAPMETKVANALAGACVGGTLAQAVPMFVGSYQTVMLVIDCP